MFCDAVVVNEETQVVLYRIKYGGKRALALDLTFVILCDLNQELSDESASKQVGTSIQCRLLVYHGFLDSAKQKHFSMISVGSIPGLADQWASLHHFTFIISWFQLGRAPTLSKFSSLWGRPD